MRPLAAIALLIASLTHLYYPELSMADTFYVATDGDDGNDGSEDYPWGTIQGAIDNSAVENDDTLYIQAGTFTENVVVNKSLKIIGDETQYPVITAQDSSDNVLTILSDDVTIEYLTLKGATGSEAAGVYVDGDYDDFSMRYCTSANNENGMYLENADGATVYNNAFENCEKGIYLYYASDTSVIYNSFEGNTVGIYLVQSEAEDIYSNTFENGDYGIFLKDDDDDYYTEDDVSQLEDDNTFDEISTANVYLGETIEEEDEGLSCFIRTISLYYDI